MLIQDFKVKPKPVYRRHSEVCRDCIRIEKLYREYPGFKQGVVYYVAQPCRSLLKKPPKFNYTEEERKASHELLSFFKKTGAIRIQQGTDKKGKEVWIISKNTPDRK